MGVPLQTERDLNTAARIGQSLVRQNSVLMGEHSKLEAMLGSAREDVTGQGGGEGACHLRPTYSTPTPPRAWTCARPRLRSDGAPLPHCQILHLRYQVSLRDDLLQLYSDSEEEEEEEEEGEPEEEEQPHYHSYGAPEP